MRSNLLPLALILSVAAGGAALAADATGVVKAVDAKAHTVTLEDGTVYKVGPKVDLKDIAAGKKVMITYEKKGKDMDASAVKLVK